MSSGRCARLGFGLLLLCNCKTTDATPGHPSSAAATITVAAPAPTAAATTAAEPAAASSAALPPAAFARLPSGAALYAAARTEVIDRLLEVVPEAKEARAGLADVLGGDGPVAQVLARLGVAPDRPVLVAVLSAERAQARRIIDAAARGTVVDLPASEPALATLIRIVVPLTVGGPRPFDLGVVGRVLEQKQLERCPGAKLCQQVGGADLVAVVRGRELVAAVRLTPEAAEIDVARPLLVEPSHASVALALRAFAGAPTGGPEPPRCARLDPTALASLCIDADRMAELGAANGYGLTVAAVAAVPLAPAERTRLLETGRKESDRNLELSTPARRLVDDGTLSILAAPSGLSLRASWALTASSRPQIEAAFATEVCAASGALGVELLPKLSQAFGDPGPDFAKPRERAEQVQEAGWAAYPILFARTWPNFLPGALAELGTKAPELARAGRTCARVSQGRLEIEGSIPR